MGKVSEFGVSNGKCPEILEATFFRMYFVAMTPRVISYQHLEYGPVLSLAPQYILVPYMSRDEVFEVMQDFAYQPYF